MLEIALDRLRVLVSLSSTLTSYQSALSNIVLCIMVQTWTSVLMNQSVINNVTTHREATNVPVTLGTPSTPLTDEPAQVRDFRLYNRHCHTYYLCIGFLRRSKNYFCLVRLCCSRHVSNRTTMFYKYSEWLSLHERLEFNTR